MHNPALSFSKLSCGIVRFAQTEKPTNTPNSDFVDCSLQLMRDCVVQKWICSLLSVRHTELWRTRLHLICAGQHSIYSDVVFGRPSVKRFALSDRCLPCLSCLSVCNVGVLSPNGWMDQDETWHVGRPRPRQHCVRWGPSSPTAPTTAAPTFEIYGRRLCLRPYNLRPMSFVANWWMDQDAHLAWR